MNNKNKPKSIFGLGYIFIPLIVNLLISYLVQMLFVGYVYFKETMRLIQNSPEMQAFLRKVQESSGSIDFSDIGVEVEKIMTTELTTELVNSIYTQVLSYTAIITIVTGVLTIPIFCWMMKRDRKRAQGIVYPIKQKLPITKYILILLGSISLCVALNNLLTLSQLANISKLYQETSEALYSINFPLQVIGLGIITPIAEEILYRGVLYNRLKRISSLYMAMGFSTLIFGLLHVNLVQMIYALICGFVFVWLYEKYGSLKAPIMAHICMNITSVFLTQYSVFVWIYENKIRMTIVTVVCATLTAAVYVCIANIPNEYKKIQE